MQSFTYVARNPVTGQKIKADIEAENEQSAAKLLAKGGLVPLEITQKKAGSSFGGFGHRIPGKQKVIFSRQLSTLINAGLPLVQSLRTVESQSRNKRLKEIISKTIADVEAGSSLSEALGKYPTVFNDVFVSLIAAGEASGTLDTSLERLAAQQEKDAAVVSKIRGALIYPLIVLLVLFGVVLFMMTTVLPQVQILYKGIPGARLPFITTALLAFSHAVTTYWWLFVLAVAGIGFLTFYWGRRTPAGRRAMDGIKIKAWPFNQLFMKFYMSRFSRTASILAASGVPMIQMLNTTADAIGNVLIADSVRKAIKEVEAGHPLSDSIKDDPHFLSLVPDMIKIGEQSGQMEGMLGRVADYYEKEVDEQIKTVSTLIEPLMMVIVGVVALIIVAAVLLPIYGLANKNLAN